MKEYLTNATKTAATLRLVVGGYLLYLDYSVFEFAIGRSGWERVIQLLILALFFVAGSALVVFSAIALVKGFLAERKEKDPNAEEPGDSEQTEETAEREKPEQREDSAVSAEEPEEPTDPEE